MKQETVRERSRTRPLVVLDDETATKFPARAPAGHVSRAAIGKVALGAFAIGAVACGAAAIGALAVGRLAVRRARFGKLEVDELTVGRLRLKDFAAKGEPS